MPSLFQPLTDAEWDGAGADVWRTPAPLVASTTYLPDGTLVVVLVESNPGSQGGIPAVQLSDSDVAVYAEHADGRRKSTGAVVGVFGWADVGAADPKLRTRVYTDASRPRWIGDDDPATFLQGLLARVDIRPAGLGNGHGFQVVIRVPWSWWAVDLARFLWILTRFYAPVDGTDYLDRQALVDFSAGVYSYLRRRRLFTWRTAGESLADHAKRLAVESGAILRWGGYVDGSDTVQQLGLGALDYDSLRRISTVYDADPLGDAGRDMFLTEPLVLRTADEYRVNSAVITWGAGWARWLNAQGALESEVQLPFAPRDNPLAFSNPQLEAPANILEESDLIDIGQRGGRYFEATHPAPLGRSSADGLVPMRWTPPRRVVEWTMGPVHWDFDPGDIIPVRHTGLGLDGAEDLLVLRKVIDWTTLHATITALEVSVDPPPQDPVGGLPLSCGVWLRADLGLIGSGGLVTTWVNLAPGIGHAVPRGGITAPALTTPAAGIAGYPVADFGAGGIRGLEIPGVFAPSITDGSGVTVIAVVRLDSQDPGMVFTSTDDGPDLEWGLGFHATVVGQSWVTFRHPDGGTTFHTNGVASTPLVGAWHILTMVYHFDAEGERVELLRGSENNGTPVEDVATDYLSFEDMGIGFSSWGSDDTLPGQLAELQVFGTALRPAIIRALHAGIRARYPGEGL